MDHVYLVSEIIRVVFGTLSFILACIFILFVVYNWAINRS